MSLINSAASAYHLTARLAAESSPPNAAASAAPAPREAELARQLDTRLTGELSRIRQQINSGPSSGSAPSDGPGQRLDIRA